MLILIYTGVFFSSKNASWLTQICRKNLFFSYQKGNVACLSYNALFFWFIADIFDIWAQKVVFDVTCIIIKPSMRLGCILIDEFIKRDTKNSKSINTAQTWIFSRNYSYNPSFRTINFSDDQNFYSIW